MTQTIRTREEAQNCENNRIVLADADSFEMIDSEINFSGEGNILYCEENVSLNSCRINFNANNSVVYLSSSKHPYNINLHVYNNCTCYFGKNAYFNGKLHVICSEEKQIIIGDDALLSFGIWIRTADPHLVYSTKTKERLNPSRSVFIGDHVWIGQSALILKGSKIHSGSIIGGGAVVAGCRVPSNTSYAGNPAKKIAEDIFWDSRSVHKWVEKDTETNRHYNKKQTFIYNEDSKTLEVESMDAELTRRKDPNERLEYLVSFAQEKNPNRFSYNSESKTVKRGLWKIINTK